jgi:hypothetical protein
VLHGKFLYNQQLDSLRNNTMKKVALKYIGDNGEEAEVITSKFISLTFTDLFPRNELFEIKAKVDAGDAKINGEVVENDSTITVPIKFSSEMAVYAIVINGWLPITFRNSEWLVPDRNLVSSIIQIDSKNLNNKNKAIEWWLSFIKESDIVINPLLYAIEGNQKKKPSYNEFCESFDKAVNKLSSYFPKGKVISYNSKKFYQAGYSILEEITETQTNEISFLLETAPLVSTSYSSQQLGKIQKEIDEIAIKYNLLGKSFLYFLVISCLYERNDSKFFKAARKVLKPKQSYNESDAYNTISDINILNIFIQSWSIFGELFPICTCDNGLVAFWSGLNPIKISSKNKKIDIEFTFNECLFPRLSIEQRHQLATSIKEKRNLIVMP